VWWPGWPSLVNCYAAKQRRRSRSGKKRIIVHYPQQVIGMALSTQVASFLTSQTVHNLPMNLPIILTLIAWLIGKHRTWFEEGLLSICRYHTKCVNVNGSVLWIIEPLLHCSATELPYFIIAEVHYVLRECLAQYHTLALAYA
jgi:hypothetical protein